MSKQKIINKKDCLKIIKPNNESAIHPLLNCDFKFLDTTRNFDLCHVLPQYYNNIFVTTMRTALLDTDNNNNVKLSMGETDNNENVKIINKCIIDNNIPCFDPIINFTLPVNSHNFLEIVFDIQNIEQLYEWFDTFDIENKKIINLVLDLFWINNFDKLDNNIELFIKLNQKIIKLLFNKDISTEIMSKISNKLIQRNFGKKIKYLTKIKKYLTKYI